MLRMAMIILLFSWDSMFAQEQKIDLETPKMLCLHIMNENVGVGQEAFDKTQLDYRKTFEKKGYTFGEEAIDLDNHFTLYQPQDVWTIFEEIELLEAKEKRQPSGMGGSINFYDSKQSSKRLSEDCGFFRKDEIFLEYSLGYQADSEGSCETFGKRIPYSSWKVETCVDVVLGPIPHFKTVASHTVLIQGQKKAWPKNSQKESWSLWDRKKTLVLGFDANENFFDNLWASAEEPDVIHTFGSLRTKEEGSGTFLNLTLNPSAHVKFNMICQQKKNLQSLKPNGALQTVYWAI